MGKIKAKKNLAKAVETPQLPRRIQQQANHQQVLRYLDSVVALSPVSRQEHIRVQRAIEQIGGAINELERLKAKKE